MPDESSEYIFGKNSVSECLDSGVSVLKIWMQKSNNPRLKEIEMKAREQKVPVFKVDNIELDRISNKEDHRGAIALITPVKIEDESYLLREDVKTILIAANIEDPHNLGAMIRSAYGFGVDAFVISNRNSAPITSTVISSSAGACLKQTIVRIGNITDCIEKLKKNFFWVYGTNVRSEEAGKMHTEDLNKIKFDNKSVILMGNEGKGLSEKLLKHCDFLVHIPMKFESLNVSVATGIILNRVYSQNS